jgi:hypothetical protein
VPFGAERIYNPSGAVGRARRGGGDARGERGGTEGMTPDERRRESVEAWLRAAVGDAERRGRPELTPLLEGLARATLALRAADWNDEVPASRDPGGA